MDIIGRMVVGVLRLAASAMVLVGVCLLVAALPLFGATGAGGVAAAIARAAIVTASTFIVAGLAAGFLARARVPLLPNEGNSSDEASQIESATWQLAFAVALVVMPAIMIVRLRPLAALWTEAFTLMDDAKVWDVLGSGAQFSGIVLIPIAAALTVPALACASAAAFIAGSIASLILLPGRRSSFPRVYSIIVLLQAGLVAGTLYGASLARRAADALETEIQQHAIAGTQVEAASIVTRIRQYDGVIVSSSATLGWTLCGYAIWLVPLLGFALPRARPQERADARARHATSPDRTGLGR